MNKWLQRCLGNKCFCNKMCLTKSDTLGNVQKKFSNNISPHSFGTWSSIRIITKATHICNCIIRQHTFKCIWIEKHNNWYYMMMITSELISICWPVFISLLVIIRNICSGCVFLRFVNIIKGKQLCLLVSEFIITQLMVFFLKLWKY